MQRGARLKRSLGLGVLLSGIAAATWLTGSSSAAAPAVAVFPISGSQVAPPHSQITFRGIPAGQIGTVTVAGTRSGAHAGTIQADSDGRGGSVIPQTAFVPGETVAVTNG